MRVSHSIVSLLIFIAYPLTSYRASLYIYIDWSNAHTTDGETCLHLAAIPGSNGITKVLLEAGADPNARTTFDKVNLILCLYCGVLFFPKAHLFLL